MANVGATRAIVSSPGGGGGAVSSVTANDASLVIAPNVGAVKANTGTLDQVANLHPPAADWSNAGHKITSLGTPTVNGDAMPYGFTEGGDLAGPIQAPTVARIQTEPVSAAAPANNQAFVWNGALWLPSNIVNSLAAADGSLVVSASTGAITAHTGTLDAVAAAQPPGADWSNNSHKITSLANGSAASDAAAFGQIPTTASQIDAMDEFSNVGYTMTTTVGDNETSVFSGSSASQTLTLPNAPRDGTFNTVINLSTVTVTVAAGASDSINLNGAIGSVVLYPDIHLVLSYRASTNTWFAVSENVVQVITAYADMGTTNFIPADTAAHAITGLQLTLGIGTWAYQVQASLNGGAVAAATMDVWIAAGTATIVFPGAGGRPNGMRVVNPTATGADNAGTGIIDGAFLVTGAGTVNVMLQASQGNGTIPTVLAQRAPSGQTYQSSWFSAIRIA